MHLSGWDERQGKSLGLINKNGTLEDEVEQKSWGILANIFYDLPAEGVESTSSFITRSAIQNMPFRIESKSDCVQS